MFSFCSLNILKPRHSFGCRKKLSVREKDTEKNEAVVKKKS